MAAVLSPARREELSKMVIPIAQEFRERYLDKGPIKDTFKTLEKLGYFIVRFPAHDDLSGFHIKKSNIDCVFINSAHSLGRQYYSAWHECYHAYTGDGGGITLFGEISHSETEYKAECFASNILMPEDLIKSYVTHNFPQDLSYVSYDQLIRMQNYFRVSYKALITRLRIVFPEFNHALSRRYSLGNKGRELELLEKTIQADGDPDLIQSTNDVYISRRFYEKLEVNLGEDRISPDKASSILELIKRAGDQT